MKDLLATARGALFTFWCSRFRRGIDIKPGLKLYRRVRISGPGSVSIGSNCVIDGIEGDNSHFACLHAMSSESRIEIGDNVQLLAARLSAKFEIVVGNDAVLEESAIIDTNFHSIHREREDSEEMRESCKVTIGDRVVLGARSMVMKGVTIGDDVVVMPGSIVVTPIKSNSVICGNPARQLKEK